MSHRIRYVWILPLAVLLLSAAAYYWRSIERRRMLDDIDGMVISHVSSVARLVKAGADEGTTSIDLMYALAEDNLWSIADMIAGEVRPGAPDSLPEHFKGSTTVIRIDVNGNLDGFWTEGIEPRLESIVSTVLDAEEGAVVDQGVLKDANLYCAHFALPPSTFVLCRDADQLVSLRRATGLGTLLNAVATDDVLYAAIQDQTGILAASADAQVTTWKEDPILAEVISENALTFRRLDGSFEDEDASVVEGLAPMSLPDGTVALLRVGVDGTSFDRIQAEVDERHEILAWVLSVLILMSFFVTGMWHIWTLRRRSLETALERRAEQNRHWRTIGEMAATVAHEVRNPLNTIQMVAQRLEAEFEVAPEEREEFQTLVALVSSESSRLGKVVTDFLALGRPLELQLALAEVAEVIEAALSPLDLRAQNEAKTISRSWQSPGKCKLDADRVGQIVANLVGNALDALEAGGRVRVTAERRGQEVVIAIADNGPGMDAGTLDKIKQPFVTYKPYGTGLGLPLTERLVEAHGGRLTIDSTPERGTTVEVFFPAGGSKTHQGRRSWPRK